MSFADTSFSLAMIQGGLLYKVFKLFAMTSPRTFRHALEANNI